MMSFETPPFRPPSEARSLLVRATRNCSWNRCAFCYGVHWNRNKLEIRSVTDIKQDILAMQSCTKEIMEWAEEKHCTDRIEQVAAANGIWWLTRGNVKNAFIGDLDALIMKTGDMVDVLIFIRENFPTIERITCYARAKTILIKTPEELEKLHQAGLSRLHVGLETGDEKLLKFINKGVTPEEIIEAGIRVKNAGITLSEFVILGLGGQERWREHAKATASVLNRIDPDFIRVRTLGIVPGTPLHEAVVRGDFKELSEKGILEEERLFIEKLNVNSEFVSDHMSNYLPVNGQLPGAKQAMLDRLDDELL